MTRYVNESEAIFETELTNLTKLHSLLEELTTSSAELSAINEQLEELFPVEELEAEYEATIQYSDKAIDQITWVLRQINELERAEASATATWSKKRHDS